MSAKNLAVVVAIRTLGVTLQIPPPNGSTVVNLIVILQHTRATLEVKLRTVAVMILTREKDCIQQMVKPA